LTAEPAPPTTEQIVALRAKYASPSDAERPPALPLTMFRQWELQQVAADALARIGEPAIPELVRLLEHPDAIPRARAAWALGRMGAKAKPAVPALMAALDDDDRLVRETAARALGQIGPDAAEAIPDLVRLLTLPAEKDSSVPPPIGRGNWIPP
jgi:HEAT repeat protein